MRKPFRWLGWGKQTESRVTESIPRRAAGKVIKAGQDSRPAMFMAGRSLGGLAGIIPRRNLILDFDIEQLQNYTTTQILNSINAISPDASMAEWIVLRLCSSAISYKVLDKTGSESVQGKAYADELVKQFSPEKGGIEALFNQAIKTVYVQGACCGEVVLEKNLHDVRDLVMVDPAVVTYFREERGQGEEKQYLQVPKQLQGGVYVSLEKEGFYYVPLDPDIDDPYGVSPILSAIPIIFFYLRVLYDLKQVVHNQAWARLHVQVLEEVLRKNVSPKLQQNDKKMAEFIDNQLGKIQDLYNALEPDDTFVTTDATSIDEVGGKASGGMVSVQSLLKVLDRLLANSMKVMSIFVNQYTGKTETYSSVEWMIQVEGIKSIRRVVKTLFDQAFTFMLRVKGIQARVEFEFEPIQINGIVTEETVAWLRTRRVLTERDAGIIDHNHAAQILYNLDVAEGEEKPMTGGASTSAGTPGTGEPADRVIPGSDPDLDPEGARAPAAESYTEGWKGIKNSRARSIEQAFIREMAREYGNLSDAAMKVILESLELE